MTGSVCTFAFCRLYFPVSYCRSMSSTRSGDDIPVAILPIHGHQHACVVFNEQLCMTQDTDATRIPSQRSSRTWYQRLACNNLAPFRQYDMHSSINIRISCTTTSKEFIVTLRDQQQIKLATFFLLIDQVHVFSRRFAVAYEQTTIAVVFFGICPSLRHIINTNELPHHTRQLQEHSGHYISRRTIRLSVDSPFF